MSVSGEHVEVLLPPAPLEGVVVCAIVRRVERIPTAAPLRSNVQANTYGCLNLTCEGSVRIRGRALPRLFLTGPFSAPVETEVTGTLRSTSVVIQPWLVAHLTGCATVDLVDQLVALQPGQHKGLGNVVAAACQISADSTVATAFWNALATFFSSKGGIVEPQLALAVLRDHGVRAAAAECSLSERHYRRRFVQAMGLRPSAWVRIDRLEHLMEGMSAHNAASLSALAADTGYSDQAHLSREARALLRQSPSALRRTLQGQSESPAPWSLQPAGPISSRRGRPR